MSTSSEQNATIVQRFNDAFNDRDWDTAASLVAPQATLVNMSSGDTFHGQDGARGFLGVWATAFPDSRVETIEIIAGDRGAVIEFWGRGTQTGPLATPMGELRATGRSVEHRFCSVNRIEDGKITESRLYFDLAGFLQQLGISAPPG